jgi:1,2-phenylacetyl-CoA epoxidase PaaB subunit
MMAGQASRPRIQGRSVRKIGCFMTPPIEIAVVDARQNFARRLVATARDRFNATGGQAG